MYAFKIFRRCVGALAAGVVAMQLARVFALTGAVEGDTISNLVAIDNQSGKRVLMQLVGPDAKSLEVANDEIRQVAIGPGQYHLVIRQGDKPGKYLYFKSGRFTVNETRTRYTGVCITLLKDIATLEGFQTATSADFDAASVVTRELNPAPRSEGEFVGVEQRGTTDEAFLTLDQFRRPQAQPAAGQPKLDRNRFFPLGVGGLWEYRRVVCPGCRFVDLQLQLNGYALVLNKVEGEIQRYEIESRKGSWVRKGSSPDLADGTFVVRVTATGKASTSSQVLWTYKKTSEVLEAAPPLETFGVVNLNLARIRILFPSISQTGISDVISTISYSLSREESRLRVPAGEFAGCLEIIEKVVLDKDKGDWYQTFNYYAPGVGLVLSYQTDNSGKPNGYVELLRYRQLLFHPAVPEVH